RLCSSTAAACLCDWSPPILPATSIRFFRSRFTPLTILLPLLQEHFSNTGHFPKNDVEYASFLQDEGVDASTLRDPWGQPFHPRRTYQWMNEVFEFNSAGPDKSLKTADDFTAISLSRPFFEFDAR